MVGPQGVGGSAEPVGDADGDDGGSEAGEIVPVLGLEVDGAHDQVRRGLIGPKLTEEEKMAIIEHLKVRDDDRDGPEQPTTGFPTCRSPK